MKSYSTTHETMYADMRAEMLRSAALSPEDTAYLKHIGDRAEYPTRDCDALDGMWQDYGDEGLLE